MEDSLENSYSYCCQIAKSQAKNFYYSFLLLPKEKREAMCAIYSFMRYCDDAVDDSNGLSEKKNSLDKCKSELNNAFRGEYGGNQLFLAFQDTVQKYQIPNSYFYELIDGMEMDLGISYYQTFEDLYRYCYKAASVVGLVTIHVFQFKDERAKEFAEYCGIGFQLTNIIRDIAEDFQRGRIYLPQEDLQRFHCRESDLSAGKLTVNMLNLLEFEVNRAQEYYTKALPLIPLIKEDARPCLIAMMKIYGGLLFEIRKKRYDVFKKRIRLPAWKKLVIGGQAWLDAHSQQ